MPWAAMAALSGRAGAEQCRRRRLGRRPRALAAAAASCAAALAGLRRGCAAQEVASAAATCAQRGGLHAAGSAAAFLSFGPSSHLPSVVLADALPRSSSEGGVIVPDFASLTGVGGSTDASLGPDLFYYVYQGAFLIIVAVAGWAFSREYFENRFLVDRINKAKMQFIADEDKTTALERFELARLYNELRDYPAALGEFEEAELEWSETRGRFDPEDAMGALAARAKMHNSKGYALTRLEPPKTPAARKEFVRAVTFWPEYPEALFNIAQELIKRQRFDVAVRTLEAALKWQPGSSAMKEAWEFAQAGAEAAKAAAAAKEELYEEDDSDEE